jgi:hypothetical protein
VTIVHQFEDQPPGRITFTVNPQSTIFWAAESSQLRQPCVLFADHPDFFCSLRSGDAMPQPKKQADRPTVPPWTKSTKADAVDPGSTIHSIIWAINFKFYF